MKDTGEGPGSPKPVKITDLPRGTFIDTLTVSPDGSMVLFTTLTGKTAADLRSTMMTVHADGSGGVTSFGDGKTLDLTPCFTPDGNQIVFASNRGGRRLSVWEMSAIGDPGMTQLTNYEENVLWPVVDSDPKPRLFWEALIDTRTEPRLFMTQLGANSRMELTRGGGMQPRVSPKADSILYTAINEKSGKRQILRVPDGGGVPSLLTSATDADEHDPVWSRDGNRIAYVSDQGTDEDGTHNDDIWALDVEHPDRPVRITVNGSVDDCPAWDPGGRAIFFRSNRGGEWAIWRIAVK
jgi:TolB protein